MTSPPHEIPSESALTRETGFLAKEYKADKIVSAEYDRIDENAKILFEIWHTSSSLDAYTIAQRYSMNENMDYNKDLDLYISDTASCFSRGEYFLMINVSSRFITSRGEIIKAAMFASDRVHVSGANPVYSSDLGRDIVFFRNPGETFAGLHDYFEGEVQIQGKEYHAAYFIRNTTDDADRDFSDLLKKSTDAVITDFSDVRSFFVRSKRERVTVFYLQNNIVVCVVDAMSINDGKNACRTIFQKIGSSIPPKRG